MSLRFGYSKITYQSLYDSMGLTPIPIMNAPAPGPQWPVRAFITMGNIPHGASVSPSFSNTVHTLYDTAPGSGILIPGSNGEWLLNNWWNKLVPWIAIIPGANNRCTNAVFLVTDAQVQYFSISQQQWIALSNSTDRSRMWTSSWYSFDYVSSLGAADLVWASSFNSPFYSCVKVSGDRASQDTLPPTGSKYGILHSGILASSSAVDISSINTDIGGVFVSAAVRMATADGSALNSASVEYMAQVAADYMPEVGFGLNAGKMVNIYASPAVGASSWKLIPTDGSTLRLYFVTTNANPNTFVLPNSAYTAVNGAASICMSAATLQANIPQLMTF